LVEKSGDQDQFLDQSKRAKTLTTVHITVRLLKELCTRKKGKAFNF